MYQLRPPAPALLPYIEHYWFVSSEAGDLDLRVEVFVDGRADLIFNLGVPYRRQVIGGATEEHRRSNLDAQRLVPIRILQQGAVRIVGVRFRLGGLGPFVGEALGRLTGATPPPERVFGAEALALEAAIHGADIDGGKGLLDAFFSERLRHDGSREGFERGLAALQASGGRDSIDAVAAVAGTSVRQLQRCFDRQIGLPPKTVGRILRFQGALRRLMRDPGCSLAEVALQAGYFDQAHFVKDFRRMSGGVPRGYRGYYPPAGPADFAPNVVVFVQEEAPALP